MKKLTFCLMALAMAASTMFTSCGDDDDDDDDDDNNNGNVLEKINSLSATVKDGNTFTTSKAAFYQSANSENAGTSKLSDFFSGSTSTSTTIVGTENGKQLAINLKGTKTGTYELSLGTSDADVVNAIVNILGGQSVKDVITNTVKSDALIIYRTSGDDESKPSYYMSSKAIVTANFDLLVYSTGNFEATMVNSSKDSFILKGEFKVFGKPTLQTGN